jgi:hypothetical protein
LFGGKLEFKGNYYMYGSYERELYSAGASASSMGDLQLWLLFVLFVAKMSQQFLTYIFGFDIFIPFIWQIYYKKHLLKIFPPALKIKINVEI